MKLNYLVPILLVLFSQPALSQEVSSEKHDIYNKNLVYGTAGFVMVYGTALANYERIVYESPDTFFSLLGLRIGTGPWAFWDTDGYNYYSTIQAATGRRKGHFEIGGGIAVIKESNAPETMVWPCANAGYRFQSPGGFFLMKTGVGFPESVYFSIGLSF